MDERFRSVRLNTDFIEYVGEGYEFSREWTSFMEGVVKFYKEELK